MIAADDPRHGTVAGHAAGCREDCCDAAKLRYDKWRRLCVAQGKPFTVPAVGTMRRIRALQALGHSLPAIAAAAGVSWRTVNNACYRVDNVYRDTAEAVDRAYRQLSMEIPEGGYAERNRRLARRMGWPPPLAWEDIDNPHEIPAGAYTERRRADDIDPVVVQRILNGERLKSTAAEKAEALRQWRELGRPVAELERVLGIKAERYSGKVVAA